MKALIKKTLAVVLAIVMVSSTFLCFAAELNQSAVELHRGQYKNYVLLGDSVASGYRDVMSDNDDEYNKAYQETTYCRVPGSYADVLAEAIIEDNSMIAFAAPGFRTIEIRYMLEDDFDEEDDYLFHPAQLNTVGDAGSEEYRAAYKKAIAEADLITLGVGGNDWGAYLTWVIADVMEQETVADEYMVMLKELLENNEMDVSMIDDLVEIAHLAGVLPDLATTIPDTLAYGLGNFYKNWDIMIQDIYDLNPDVTIMVLGMSDNSLKGNYFDYDGVEGGPVNGDEAADESSAALTSTIVDFIMSVGNAPMIEGAKKFGYTYVDTAGTTYVDSHPDAAGHVFIANKIIEALPDPEIIETYEDIKPGDKYYSAIEYVLKNGIMSPISDTAFGSGEALTIGDMNAAFNAINGTALSIESTDEATAKDLSLAFLTVGIKGGFSGFFKGIALSFKVMAGSSFIMNAEVSRGEAANYFAAFCQD